MRRVFVLAAAVAAMFALAIPVSAAQGFIVHLDGAQEVSGGDPDGAGVAKLRFDRDGTVCFDIDVIRVEPIAAGHIHSAPAGVDGPVVVDFDVAANGLSGCVTAEPNLLRAIRRSPADYYVNLHNADFPGGAIRGQLG